MFPELNNVGHRPSPHFAPLTPQNAEREKRSQRLGTEMRRVVQEFSAGRRKLPAGRGCYIIQVEAFMKCLTL
jgi:hypothetical protein